MTSGSNRLFGLETRPCVQLESHSYSHPINRFIVTEAYSKYQCIHQTSSTSTRATTTLLEEDFAHFGYPHTIVSDNTTTFSSAEFQLWCHQRGIKHPTGASYHPVLFCIGLLIELNIIISTSTTSCYPRQRYNRKEGV